MFARLTRPRSFHHHALGAFALLCGSYIGANMLVDDFGLWDRRQAIRIWEQERMSKYLLAKHYVPRHYPRVIAGPSYSNNLNPRDFGDLELYNLSVDGATLAELAKLLLAATEGPHGVREVLLCLHPFVFRSVEEKTNQMDDRWVWRSVFSSLPLEVMWWKLQDARGRGNPRFAHSQHGYSDYSAGKRLKPFEAFVAERRQHFTENPPTLSWQAEAVEQLASVLDTLRARGVRISAYYYPMYHEFFQHWRDSGAWGDFTRALNALFDTDERVVDFNHASFRTLTERPEHYVDTHLSHLGAQVMSQLLLEQGLLGPRRAKVGAPARQ